MNIKKIRLTWHKFLWWSGINVWTINEHEAKKYSLRHPYKQHIWDLEIPYEQAVRELKKGAKKTCQK